MTEQRIRWQHPDKGEIVFSLNSEEREYVDTALETLGVDMGLFINMAFKWCNANCDFSDSVGAEYGEKVDDSDKSRTELLEEARSELLQRNVAAFAEFVATENPDAEWIAGKGELSLFGDLEP